MGKKLRRERGGDHGPRTKGMKERVGGLCELKRQVRRVLFN